MNKILIAALLLGCGAPCPPSGAWDFTIVTDAGCGPGPHRVTISPDDGGLHASSTLDSLCGSGFWTADSDGGAGLHVSGRASCVFSGEQNGFSYSADFSSCGGPAVVQYSLDWSCGSPGSPPRTFQAFVSRAQ
jgi:hypothetical protein